MTPELWGSSSEPQGPQTQSETCGFYPFQGHHCRHHSCCCYFCQLLLSLSSPCSPGTMLSALCVLTHSVLAAFWRWCLSSSPILQMGKLRFKGVNPPCSYSPFASRAHAPINRTYCLCEAPFDASTRQDPPIIGLCPALCNPLAHPLALQRLRTGPV